MGGFSKETYDITLELGHKAEVKPHIWDNPSHMVVEQEPTHQWECWVNAKVGDMSKYVDKVVFNLHETFPKPKRVVNSPDNGKYLISEQGYAGFEIFLEIYFKGLPANDPVRKVKIKYDLFLTPSMELLYADPKRINVKKTSVFYRLEKITISHADPKFIKLLELGGAQKESGDMASASSDKTTSTSNSKSTGGGYYTNDFKQSGKKDATPDKSSKSKGSYSERASSVYDRRERDQGFPRSMSTNRVSLRSSYTPGNGYFTHQYSSQRRDSEFHNARRTGHDRGYTTSQSATSKSSSHATKDRHRNSSSSRTGTSDRGSYRSRSRERNERSDTKKRDSSRSGSKDRIRDRHEDVKTNTSSSKTSSGHNSDMQHKTSTSKGYKEESSTSISYKTSKSTRPPINKELDKDIDTNKGKTSSFKNTEKESESKHKSLPISSKPPDRSTSSSAISTQPKSTILQQKDKQRSERTKDGSVKYETDRSKISSNKDQKDKQKDSRNSTALFSEQPEKSSTTQKELLKRDRKQEKDIPNKITSNDKKDPLRTGSNEIKSKSTEKITNSPQIDERKTTSRPATPSKTLSKNNKQKDSSHHRSASDRNSSPSNLIKKQSSPDNSENSTNKDSKILNANSTVKHDQKAESSKNSSTKKDSAALSNIRGQEKDKERKEYAKDKEKRKSDEKSLASNSIKSSSHSSMKPRPMDTNASSGNKIKLEKTIPLEKEPEGYLNDKKIRDSVQKTESTAKKKEYENVKNYNKDSRRNDSLSRESIKKCADESRSENKEKERRDVQQKGNQPNLKAKESKEKVKTTISDLKKEDCRKTVREEKRGTETNLKLVNYKNGQLKKETEPIQQDKCKQPTAKLKLEEETPIVKIETDTKRKEKNAPKGMLIRNLLKAKADFADSKPKLYESDDDSHQVRQKSEDRKVKEDLALPSEYESPSMNSVNIQNESDQDHNGLQTEMKSKKSKSSRKDKSKKKSKKRDKDSLDERNDDIIKSKKKKRKDKEKKSGKKQKTYADEETYSNTIHNEGADKDEVLPLAATKLVPKSSLPNKPAHKKCVFTSETNYGFEQKLDSNEKLCEDSKHNLLDEVFNEMVCPTLSEMLSPLPLTPAASIYSPNEYILGDQSHRLSTRSSFSSNSMTLSIIKTPSPFPNYSLRNCSTSSDEGDNITNGARENSTNSIFKKSIFSDSDTDLMKYRDRANHSTPNSYADQAIMPLNSKLRISEAQEQSFLEYNKIENTDITENGRQLSTDLQSISSESYPVQVNHEALCDITKFQNPKYLNFLLQLQERLSNPKSDDNIIEVVKLIHNTGCWIVENEEFVFDFGLINEHTVWEIGKILKLQFTE